VNSLAKYHFHDPEDIALLNKLIQEENEFVLSSFDVFESDKDHENLIDSLSRILQKSKSLGLSAQKVQAHSFYSSAPWRNQSPATRAPRWESSQPPPQQQQQFNYSTERPQGAPGGRRPYPQFQPTTVHNVALIPNYFSSGEDDIAQPMNNDSHIRIREGESFEEENKRGKSQKKHSEKKKKEKKK